MKQGLTVSTDNYDRTFRFRTYEVVQSAMRRPERLYRVDDNPPADCTQYDVSGLKPEDNSFASIDAMLDAVRKWCG